MSYFQYVFSIPKILRLHFKYDRKLLGNLCLYANASLRTFLKTVTGIDGGAPGAVMAIHTFGDYYGQNKRNFLMLAAERFIAAITQHIPDTISTGCNPQDSYASWTMGRTNQTASL